MPRLSSFSSPLAYSRRVVAPKIVNTLPWNVVADDLNNSSATPPSYQILTVNDAKDIYVSNPLSAPDPVSGGYLNDRYYLFRTPYLPGVYTVTIIATNSAGSGLGDITINCSTNANLQAPVLANSIVTVSTGSVRDYLFNLNNTVTSTGGQGSIKRYSIANLPATLELIPSGIDNLGEVYGYISTPSQITLQCTRVSAGGSSTADLLVIAQTINLSVSAPVISIPVAPKVTIGTAFTYQILATNSPTAYYSTALPTGLSINSTTGVISGTYNGSVGQSLVRISANNAGGSTGAYNLYLDLATYVGWALNSSSPTDTWGEVAMDATGTIMAAVISNSIWVSSDSGTTWVRKLLNNCRGVALSKNAGMLVALESYGRIKLSTDLGENWSISGPTSDQSWAHAAVSSNGAMIVAVTNPGRLYYVNSSGGFWFEGSPANTQWAGVAMSSNGSARTAITFNEELYTNINSSSSWIKKVISGIAVGEGLYSIAMNSSGVIQTVISGSKVYTSSDYGDTWTARYTAPSGYNFNYGVVAMSSSGDKQYIAAYQRIYKSIDYGVTWTIDEAPVVVYGGLALSSDGTKGLAASRASVFNVGRGYKLIV